MIKNIIDRINELEESSLSIKLLNDTKSLLDDISFAQLNDKISEEEETKLSQRIDSIIFDKIRAINENLSEETIRRIIIGSIHRASALSLRDIIVVGEAVFIKENEPNDENSFPSKKSLSIQSNKKEDDYKEVIDSSYIYNNWEEPVPEAYQPEYKKKLTSEEKVSIARYIVSSLNIIGKGMYGYDIVFADISSDDKTDGSLSYCSSKIRLFLNRNFLQFCKAYYNKEKITTSLIMVENIDNNEQFYSYIINYKMNKNNARWESIKQDTEVWKLSEATKTKGDSGRSKKRMIG